MKSAEIEDQVTGPVEVGPARTGDGVERVCRRRVGADLGAQGQHLARVQPGAGRRGSAVRSWPVAAGHLTDSAERSGARPGSGWPPPARQRVAVVELGSGWAIRARAVPVSHRQPPVTAVCSTPASASVKAGAVVRSAPSCASSGRVGVVQRDASRARQLTQMRHRGGSHSASGPGAERARRWPRCAAWRAPRALGERGDDAAGQMTGTPRSAGHGQHRLQHDAELRGRCR